MRQIDADKLLEGEHFILKCKSEFGITEMDVFRREVIENAPTVEYTFEEAFQKTVCEQRLYCPERPQGEWKQISPAKIYECTNCGQTVMTGDIECYQFCHNCGADMRGGRE